MKKFEADTSLTHNDYILANGDDYTFNGTLFGMMQATSKRNFNRDNLARYRCQHYAQSKPTTASFTLGPKSLLLYGAASFLYELFPSFGPAGSPGLQVAPTWLPFLPSLVLRLTATAAIPSIIKRRFHRIGAREKYRIQILMSPWKLSRSISSTPYSLVAMSGRAVSTHLGASDRPQMENWTPRARMCCAYCTSLP